MMRLEQEQFVELRDRFLQSLELIERNRHDIDQRNVGMVESQPLSGYFERRFIISHLEKYRRNVLHELDIWRLDRQRSAQIDLSLLVIPARRLDHAQVMQRVKIIPVAAYDLSVQRRGLIEFPGAMQRERRPEFLIILKSRHAESACHPTGLAKSHCFRVRPSVR